MKITITIPDSKYHLLETILNSIQKLIGKDMRVTAEPLKPEAKGAARPRKPSKKERMECFDEMLITGTWRKPQHLKKSK